MTTHISIEIDGSAPRIVVNGFEITSAPPMGAIHGILGEPSRVHVPAGAAPPGRRNNQIHVYDGLGVRVNEHHFTFRAQELGLTFDCDDPAYAFTPKEPFRGELVIEGRSMLLGGPEADFVRACPLPLEHTVAGRWHWKAGGFFVGLDARGDRLRAGRRSRRRQVIELSVSWPHDPWDDSARTGSMGIAGRSP